MRPSWLPELVITSALLAGATGAAFTAGDGAAAAATLVRGPAASAVQAVTEGWWQADVGRRNGENRVRVQLSVRGDRRWG